MQIDSPGLEQDGAGAGTDAALSHICQTSLIWSVRSRRQEAAREPTGAWVAQFLSSLFPGSPPADAKPVVHVGGEETNVRAVRSATSQVICTRVWGFSSSSFPRQSWLPSTAFLGRAFADVCRQTCACPACTPSCLAPTQG